MSIIVQPALDAPGRFTAYIAGQESFMRGESLSHGWSRMHCDKSRYDQFALGYTTEKADWEGRPRL